MDTAIQIIWGTALVGALLTTIIIVAEIVRIVHHAGEIKRLTNETLTAAQGIAGNTAIIAALGGVVQTGGRLLSAMESLDRTAAALERHASLLSTAPRHGEA